MTLLLVLIWGIFEYNSEKSLYIVADLERIEETKLKRKTTQQIKAYKIDISQTNRDGTFQCPNCGARISPDDHTEATYTICDIVQRNGELNELIFQCKRCLSFVNLGGFYRLYKKSQSADAMETADQNTFAYVSHI